MKRGDTGKAAAAAVVGSILALLLKKYTPELSLLAALAAGMAVAWMSVQVCSRVAETLQSPRRRPGAWRRCIPRR